MPDNVIQRRSVTVAKLGYELNRAVEIKRMLQDQEDPALILDMIEGETDLAEMCCIVYEETVEDETLLAGLEATIAAFQIRKGRIEKSIETRRGLILMAIDKAGVGKVKGPLATLGIRDVPPKPIITDESQVPAKYWKTPPPALDKAALNADLKAGEVIPGAAMGNGGIGLSIRVK